MLIGRKTETKGCFRSLKLTTVVTVWSWVVVAVTVAVAVVVMVEIKVVVVVDTDATVMVVSRPAATSAARGAIWVKPGMLPGT